MQNAYRLLILAILLLNLLYKFRQPLTRSRKPNAKMSILFIFFLSSSVTHNSKTIRCMPILYIPNDCSATEQLPFLVWGGVQATTGELRPRNGPPVCKTLVFINFCGFCLRIPGVARIVRPHPDYWTRVFYGVGPVC